MQTSACGGTHTASERSAGREVGSCRSRIATYSAHSSGGGARERFEHDEGQRSQFRWPCDEQGAVHANDFGSVQKSRIMPWQSMSTKEDCAPTTSLAARLKSKRRFELVSEGATLHRTPR